MKVCEAFEFDLDTLLERAESSEYWNSSYDFVISVLEKDVEILSNKQMDWLQKIETKHEYRDIIRGGKVVRV